MTKEEAKCRVYDLSLMRAKIEAEIMQLDRFIAQQESEALKGISPSAKEEK